MRFVFLLLTLSSCSTIVERNTVLPSEGKSGGIIYFPINVDTQTYKVIKDNQAFYIVGLPYVTEDQVVNIGDNEILVKAVNLGNQNYHKEKPQTFLTPSLEERERASAEYLLVQKLIAQRTEQLTFDLEFISPVDTLITSPYGKKRFINDAPRSPHLATDIRGKEGTPILAPKDGRAVLVANHFYGGNIVILDHGGGLFSSYSHMQKHNILQGELVKKGTVIGFVGSTGRVTGPHLHWTIYLNENRINPELFIELDYLQD
ncbi:MAG: peptidase M23 [Gammaproteobacteria bacterium]|nr:MAG: peptidase M23 [Gammaproteobacteria bacterium]